jgi:hypothetical protein
VDDHHVLNLHPSADPPILEESCVVELGQCPQPKSAWTCLKKGSMSRGNQTRTYLIEDPPQSGIARLNYPNSFFKGLGMGLTCARILLPKLS